MSLQFLISMMTAVSKELHDLQWWTIEQLFSVVSLFVKFESCFIKPYPGVTGIPAAQPRRRTGLISYDHNLTKAATKAMLTANDLRR
jgi:hypothetical protein